MSTHPLDNTVVDDDPIDHDQLFDSVEFNFSGSDIQPTRRQFVQVLGAGILIAVATPSLAEAQNPNRGRRGGGFRGGGRTTVAAAPYRKRWHDHALGRESRMRPRR